MPSEATCSAAILELLTQYPDCEMRDTDVHGELDGAWPQDLITATLEDLVRQRAVLRVVDAGTPWYCIAMDKLDSSSWTEG